jgi:sec-independent protein translocase protein TatA
MFGGIGMTELIVVLAVCLLFFGAKKLPELGGSIGKAIKNFKKGANELGEDLEIEEKKLPEKAEKKCQNQ